MEEFTHVKLLKALSQVEDKLHKKLTEAQKILLTTDGSVTRILEILTKKPVIVRTVERSIVPADLTVAEWLGVSVGDEVNYRVVELRNPESKRALAGACSWIPIARLRPEIYEDLTGSDIPIGKIISMHKLEIRREILDIDVINAKKDFTKALGVKVGSPLLSKTYNIIHNGAVLIRINEVFKP